MNHYCIHTILIQVGSGSSQCTVCDKIIPSRRIETLRTHVAKCEATPASQRQLADTDNEDTPTQRPQRRRQMSLYDVNWITDTVKHNLDCMFIRSWIRNGFSFRSMSESTLRKSFDMLTGGNYCLPHRNRFPALLEEIYLQERQEMKREISNRFGTIMLDGWTPTQANGILTSVFASPDQWHLLHSREVDENGSNASDVAEYVRLQLAEVRSCGGCCVAVVCDNASNMVLMREQLSQDMPHLAIFGCSAHLFDLVMEKFSNLEKWKSLISSVEDIQKCFRVHKVRAAFMKLPGAKAPILPAATRFHSAVDMPENFHSNRPSYRQLLALNAATEAVVTTKSKAAVDNLNSAEFLDKVQAFLEFARPLKVLLKSVETDKAPPSFVASSWLNLRRDVNAFSATWFGGAAAKKNFMNKYFNKYFGWALTSCHFAALLLDPDVDNETITLLNEQERTKAIQYLSQYVDGDWLDLWLTQRHAAALQVPECDAFITANKKKGLLQFWIKVMARTAIANQITIKGVVDIAERLNGIVSSSSTVERCFSTYGLVWTKIRNRMKSYTAFQCVFVRSRLVAKEAKQKEYEEKERQASTSSLSDFDAHASQSEGETEPEIVLENDSEDSDDVFDEEDVEMNIEA